MALKINKAEDLDHLISSSLLSAIWEKGEEVKIFEVTSVLFYQKS